MITKRVPAHWKAYKIYSVVFDQGNLQGFMFPCDKDGKLDKMTEGTKKKYDFCLAHPNYFKRFNELVEFDVPYQVEETAVCECGNAMRAGDMFGAWKCRCGRLYDRNLKEIVPKAGA